MLRDPKLKKGRGYVEKDSFVREDGSEVLVKRDWKQRKFELWERSGGKCEWPIADGYPPFVRRCTNDADDPHHIVPRWPKRDDRLDNLVSLCRMHHKLLDGRKIGGRK